MISASSKCGWYRWYIYVNMHEICPKFTFYQISPLRFEITNCRLVAQVLSEKWYKVVVVISILVVKKKVKITGVSRNTELTIIFLTNQN
jgi:hypothetical protein